MVYRVHHIPCGMKRNSVWHTSVNRKETGGLFGNEYFIPKISYGAISSASYPPEDQGSGRRTNAVALHNISRVKRCDVAKRVVSCFSWCPTPSPAARLEHALQERGKTSEVCWQVTLLAWQLLEAEKAIASLAHEQVQQPRSLGVHSQRRAAGSR